jgi:hypothetical protein
MGKNQRNALQAYLYAKKARARIREIMPKTQQEGICPLLRYV